MQALILVGGEGTRLRPLTATLPKPVVPLVDRPFIAYMLDWLKRHGVDDVIMSCGFLADGMRDVLGDGTDYGVVLRFVEEPEPLGTGGALKFASEFLEDRFLMLNGDILTDIDLTAQIALHEGRAAAATLALTPVEDPSAYGLVRTLDDGEVTGFVEKPSPDQIDTRNISAGAYVLERSVLDLLASGTPASIERDLFPRLVGNGLYGYVGEGYWLDIGTPERYLQGSYDILSGAVQTRAVAGVADDLKNAGEVVEPVCVGAGSVIAKGARIGPSAVCGAGVKIGERSIVQGSVLLDAVAVGAECSLDRAIIAADATLGDGVTVAELAVIGRGATIGSGASVGVGARVGVGATVADGQRVADGETVPDA